MQRAYYSNKIVSFLQQKPDEILGEIVRNNKFALEKKQRNTWISEIDILQTSLTHFSSGDIIFEYTIPRIGDRIDNVFIYNGIIYLIEFKVGETTYPKYARDQVIDYALDLKYFHKESHSLKIVPLLVCTNAPDSKNELYSDDDDIFQLICCNQNTLTSTLSWITNELSDTPIRTETWLNSQYMPTPTIIEAAQALYRGHDVKDISRSDADAYNLSLTTDAINKIIDYSKAHNEKSICFVTGVPGSGKTLAGLNIANSRHNFDEKEHAVFLSGNGPLVKVLREALARDEYKRSDKQISKGAAKKKAEAFIQNVHHFRDDSIKSTQAPIEKVIIFDEAQRAWTKKQTSKFMSDQGHSNWEMSEPEFLISVMNRHTDWSVIICLIGGGQEINTGEAGLPEWFDALRHHFSDWNVYLSDELSDDEYLRGLSYSDLISNLKVRTINHLHLAVSLRSFRSEQVSSFVKALLDADLETAKNLYLELHSKYPIFLTRDLNSAKQWVQEKARGNERYGLMASSGAKRLRQFGIWIQSSISPENWFLDGTDDVRSSYFLEDTATEFDVQGLEIDWAIVAWDANYRFENGIFVPYNFVGTKWNSVKNEDAQLYLKNSYRVLLTRSRQGFIIFIPKGDDYDFTRRNEFYDGVYEYLKKIGIKEFESIN